MLFNQLLEHVELRTYIKSLINEAEYINTNKLSKSETLKLIKDFQETGNIDSRNKIIEDNMKLVSYIVMKHYVKNKTYSFDDLQQIGVLAIIAAIDDFNLDIERTSFSSYAYQRIDWYVRHHLFRKSYKMNTAFSLDNKLSSDGTTTYLDQQQSASDTLQDVSKSIDVSLNRADMIKLLRHIPLNRAQAIVLLYGLDKEDDKKGRTYGEVSAILGKGISTIKDWVVKGLRDLKPLIKV